MTVILTMAAMSGCATEIDTGEAPVSADTTVVVDANTTTTMAGPTVGYVRITWRQDLDVRCTTPETFDNNGADSAVIEVWGPTDDGRWRADMIAPSGETEVVIADVAEDGTVLQSWGTYNQANPMPRGPTFEEVTAFRHVECVTSTPTSRESISISDGPYSPGRLPFPHLIPVGDRRIDVVEVLPDIATDRRADTWMGAEYDVFISSSEPPQGTTGSKQSTEYWLNPETRLIDRVLDTSQSTQTGSKESVIEFIERSTRPLDSVSFAPTGLQQISNLREFLDADESTGTTTASSNSAALPSQTADAAARDGVLLEVAALPLDVRVSVVQPHVAGARTRIVTDEGVWIISTPDSDQYEGDPLLGDPDGVYGRDFIHLSMYSEILLLDGSESKILRAFPVTPAATPGALAVSPDAVFCHRAADGGEPDSMLCRIDRTELDMIVRIFPSASGSSFGEPGVWIPDGWIIADPVDRPLVGVLEVDEGLHLVSDADVIAFDPYTLEIARGGSGGEEVNSALIALLASAEELAGIEPLGWDPSHGAPYEAYSYRRGEDIITVMATPPTEETLGLRLIFGDLGAPSIEGTVEADGLVFTLHSTAGDLRAIQLENVCSEFDAWASASSATVTTAVLMQDLGSVVDGFACPELPR